MEPVFWMAVVGNVATLGIAAAVLIPLSRAAARRLGAPRADAERVGALEAELEAVHARLEQTEERLVFMERLLGDAAEPRAIGRGAGSDPASSPR